MSSILVIDDSEAVLARVKSRLQAEGHEVVTTTQTVGSARHLHQCDLVIIDYHMPGIDGASVVKSFKAAVASSASPPLFYLFTSDRSVARDFRSHGFDGVLTGKGNEDELARQVEAALRLRRLKTLGRKP